MSAVVLVDELCAATIYVKSMRALCKHAGCPEDAATMIAKGVPIDDAMIELALAVRASRIAMLAEGHSHPVVSLYAH